MEANVSSPLFLIPVTMGSVFVLAGMALRFFPPREINYIYGYRTTNSMKSPEAWKFAQAFAGRISISSGLVFALVSVPGMLLSLNEGVAFIIAFLLFFLLIGFVFFQTERKLKQMYP